MHAQRSNRRNKRKGAAERVVNAANMTLTELCPDIGAKFINTRMTDTDASVVMLEIQAGYFVISNTGTPAPSDDCTRTVALLVAKNQEQIKTQFYCGERGVTNNLFRFTVIHDVKIRKIIIEVP